MLKNLKYLKLKKASEQLEIVKKFSFLELCHGSDLFQNIEIILKHLAVDMHEAFLNHILILLKNNHYEIHQINNFLTFLDCLSSSTCRRFIEKNAKFLNIEKLSGFITTEMLENEKTLHLIYRWMNNFGLEKVLAYFQTPKDQYHFINQLPEALLNAQIPDNHPERLGLFLDYFSEKSGEGFKIKLLIRLEPQWKKDKDLLNFNESMLRTALGSLDLQSTTSFEYYKQVILNLLHEIEQNNRQQQTVLTALLNKSIQYYFKKISLINYLVKKVNDARLGNQQSLKNLHVIFDTTLAILTFNQNTQINNGQITLEIWEQLNKNGIEPIIGISKNGKGAGASISQKLSRSIMEIKNSEITEPEEESLPESYQRDSMLAIRFSNMTDLMFPWFNGMSEDPAFINLKLANAIASTAKRTDINAPRVLEKLLNTLSESSFMGDHAIRQSIIQSIVVAANHYFLEHYRYLRESTTIFELLYFLLKQISCLSPQEKTDLLSQVMAELIPILFNFDMEEMSMFLGKAELEEEEILAIHLNALLLIHSEDVFERHFIWLIEYHAKKMSGVVEPVADLIPCFLKYLSENSRDITKQNRLVLACIKKGWLFFIPNAVNLEIQLRSLEYIKFNFPKLLNKHYPIYHFEKFKAIWERFNSVDINFQIRLFNVFEDQLFNSKTIYLDSVQIALEMLNINNVEHQEYRYNALKNIVLLLIKNSQHIDSASNTVEFLMFCHRNLHISSEEICSKIISKALREDFLLTLWSDVDEDEKEKEEIIKILSKSFSFDYRNSSNEAQRLSENSGQTSKEDISPKYYTSCYTKDRTSFLASSFTKKTIEIENERKNKIRHTFS